MTLLPSLIIYCLPPTIKLLSDFGSIWTNISHPPPTKASMSTHSKGHILDSVCCSGVTVEELPITDRLLSLVYSERSPHFSSDTPDYHSSTRTVGNSRFSLRNNVISTPRLPPATPHLLLQCHYVHFHCKNQEYPPAA